VGGLSKSVEYIAAPNCIDAPPLFE